MIVDFPSVTFGIVNVAVFSFRFIFGFRSLIFRKTCNSTSAFSSANAAAHSSNVVHSFSKWSISFGRTNRRKNGTYSLVSSICIAWLTELFSEARAVSRLASGNAAMWIVEVAAVVANTPDRDSKPNSKAIGKTREKQRTGDFW